MAPSTIIDQYYAENVTLLEYLRAAQETSLAIMASNSFSKALAISIGSFFEHEISQILREFSAKHSNNHAGIVSVIERKAITRQFHTLFDWDAGNANRFFSLFGDDIGGQFRDLVRKDTAIASAVGDFINLGALRNRMVHSNFAELSSANTPEELYERYQSAQKFIECVRGVLLQV